MSARRAAAIVAVFTVAACGLDRAGEMYVAGPVASAPGIVDATDAGEPDPTGSFAAKEPDAGSGEGKPGPIVARGDADGGSPPNATSVDASARDAGEADDAEGPVGTAPASACARLVDCCPRLLAPPLAIACLASAMEDAGESACQATLSSLVDAGVCP